MAWLLPSSNLSILLLLLVKRYHFSFMLKLAISFIYLENIIILFEQAGYFPWSTALIDDENPRENGMWLSEMGLQSPCDNLMLFYCHWCTDCLHCSAFLLCQLEKKYWIHNDCNLPSLGMFSSLFILFLSSVTFPPQV